MWYFFALLTVCSNTLLAKWIYPPSLKQSPGIPILSRMHCRKALRNLTKNTLTISDELNQITSGSPNRAEVNPGFWIAVACETQKEFFSVTFCYWEWKLKTCSIKCSMLLHLCCVHINLKEPISQRHQQTMGYAASACERLPALPALPEPQDTYWLGSTGNLLVPLYICWEF